MSLLIQITIDEPVRIPRHCYKQVTGTQKLVHGNGSSGKRVVCTHSEQIPTFE